ncbi:hypothetical protein Cgig2_027653 [Carnegiea gigantea]|uniref:Protein YIP n=1 Tax=Carnegiea gigantea TaxID=171969 RepID=A0A9Q1JG40_9CARY|nr:hypothetical protein Cgig2_027653 [Carnegiea gigantea]
MEEPYDDLPTSHLIGSVPAVVAEEKKAGAYAVPEANVQISPRQPGGDRGQGYQKIASSSGGGGPPPADNWQGVFNISSYAQYFNVDTDDVLNRLLSSLDPLRGDFFSKINANPDLYGLVWVSTTLVFVIASLGNLASYLGHSSSWSFNVGYVSLATSVVYGYAIVVPLGFYFLLRYLGLNPSLVRFWCMWGYSLFIFVLSSVSISLYVVFLLIKDLSAVSSCCVLQT